jgi:hypothetical protein
MGFYAAFNGKRASHPRHQLRYDQLIIALLTFSSVVDMVLEKRCALRLQKL